MISHFFQEFPPNCLFLWKNRVRSNSTSCSLSDLIMQQCFLNELLILSAHSASFIPCLYGIRTKSIWFFSQINFLISAASLPSWFRNRRLNGKIQFWQIGFQLQPDLLIRIYEYLQALFSRIEHNKQLWKYLMKFTVTLSTLLAVYRSVSDSSFPRVTVRTFPPHASQWAFRYLTRQQVSVLAVVPFWNQFRICCCKVVISFKDSSFCTYRARCASYSCPYNGLPFKSAGVAPPPYIFGWLLIYHSGNDRKVFIWPFFW